MSNTLTSGPQLPELTSANPGDLFFHSTNKQLHLCLGDRWVPIAHPTHVIRASQQEKSDE